MRYKKIYRDGAYVLVDPLTGSGIWDVLTTKLLPTLASAGKTAAKTAMETGSKKVGELAANKAISLLTPEPKLGNKIVKELSKVPKPSVENRISRLLNE